MKLSQYRLLPRSTIIVLNASLRGRIMQIIKKENVRVYIIHINLSCNLASSSIIRMTIYAVPIHSRHCMLNHPHSGKAQLCALNPLLCVVSTPSVSTISPLIALSIFPLSKTPSNSKPTFHTLHTYFALKPWSPK